MLVRCSSLFTTASSRISSRRLFKELDRIKVNMASVAASQQIESSAGLPLNNVVDAINSFADVSLAESWDNVGLLIEPTTAKNVKHVLLTNDLTESVMQEAIDLNIDLIVSYHPPIFAPLKRLTTKTWKERIAGKCLENRIALYSPHTSFDSIKGGVNDWLAGSFDIASSKPIQPGTNPENGMGRICQLKKTITTSEAVNLVKIRTGLSYVRLATAVAPAEKLINTIAVCAGSGASVLKDVAADLYVTGEMLHHDILDAVHKGTHVILTNHSDSERGYLRDFSTILTSSLKNSVRVSVSQKDADPLKTV